MTEREDKTPVAPSGAAEEQEILLDSPIVESEDEPGAVDAPGVSGSKEPDEAAVESTPVVEEDAVEPVPPVEEAIAGNPEAAASADADASAGLPEIPEGASSAWPQEETLPAPAAGGEPPAPVDPPSGEEEEPEEVEEPEVNQETFAIFGVDSRENNLGKGTRSDSLMVVNVDNTNKKVYIASVYRDCYVQIEGHGLDKITHAHSFGGPELAMDTLNTNFDLDIQKYITVNFMNVAELVDDMDGIEQDITEEETKYINGYIDELNGIRGTSSAHITEAGTYTLDGTQAVAFSRIRYTEGGDYKRSERQRTVLFKIFSKAQELDKAKKIDIAKSMLDKINTNYLESEVLRLLSKITEYKVEAMDAFPKVFYSGKIDGVFYEVPVTLNDMSTQMHTFLYPTETYTPSETVQSISAQESAVAPTANNDFTQQ